MSPSTASIASAPGFSRRRGEHRLGAVDPRHADAPRGQRQGDPAGADRELERAAVAGELREHVHGRVDHGGVEHRGGLVVVARRDPLAEEALLSHPAQCARRSGSSATPVRSPEYLATSLEVLACDGERVSAIVLFVSKRLFASFALPPELD